MAISVTCECGQPLTLRDDAAGKTEPSPDCSLQFRGPFGERAAPPAAAPAVPFPAPRPSPAAVPPVAAPAAPAKIWEYKVLSQKDKCFSGKFDPQLEAAMNAYAREGWRVLAVTTGGVPGFGCNRDEMIVVLER